MKTILVATALSLLSGCTAGNVYHVDSRFSPEEEQAIQQANDMWCSASREQLCMDLVFGAHVDVIETSRQAIVKAGSRAVSSRFPDFAGKPAFFHPAGTFDQKMIVVVFDRVAPENFRTAVAHEMGHAFGAVHSEDVSAVMYRDLTGAADKEAVTCSDLIAAGVSCDQTK